MSAEQPVNILLVDDRPENLLALESTLDNLGYTLVKAHSGAEALKCLLQQDFAVILLDVQMPGLDGFETAELIRGRERSQHTPIIFLTALDRSDARVFKGYAVGAVDFLFKPFMPEILRSKVAVFVQLFRQTQQIQLHAEELERRVRERTAELTRANSVLQAEVNERKRAEEALRESEERFRVLSESAPVGIFLTDTTGNCTYVNQRWQVTSGLTFEASLGAGWVDAIHPEDREQAITAWAEAVQSGSEFREDFRLMRPDGTVRWVDAGGSTMTTDTGERHGYVGVVEDITERKRTEVERERLYHEAQEAILARDEFLSIASHELKTPLTALQLQLQMLLRSATKGGAAKLTPERLLSKLQLANQQTERLASLINDLLDVARIRTGRIDIRLEEVDLAQVVRDVLERFEEQIAQSGCTVILQADQPIVALWDRSRVEQVVTNLLSNAIKYGPGKPVEISILGDAAHGQLVVRDHGIGIAPEHLERIFVRFERAVSTNHYGGLGLGLYIVRQIVEALGGTIRVASDFGAGATFTVTLPRTVPTLK